VDGCIPRRGTISSYQSAATSKNVKRCCSRFFSCKQRYIKYTELYLYLLLNCIRDFLSTLRKFGNKNLALFCAQINGENVLGVTHDKVVTLLKSRADVTIVVQRDFPSPSSSPNRSSFSGSSPQHKTPEKPEIPVRSVVNPSPTGIIFMA